jgi:hypothetical protein
VRSDSEEEQEFLLSDFVEQFLDTAGQRWAHPLALRWAAPVISCGHGPAVGGETQVAAVSAVTFAHELTDVELPAGGWPL